MQGKRLLLTLSPKIYELLSQKAEASYMSVQEFINDMIRKSLLVQLQPAKGKAGRPKKVEFEDYFSTPTKESRRIEKSGG